MGPRETVMIRPSRVTYVLVSACAGAATKAKPIIAIAAAAATLIVVMKTLVGVRSASTLAALAVPRQAPRGGGVFNLRLGYQKAPVGHFGGLAHPRRRRRRQWPRFAIPPGADRRAERRPRDALAHESVGIRGRQPTIDGEPVERAREALGIRLLADRVAVPPFDVDGAGVEPADKDETILPAADHIDLQLRGLKQSKPRLQLVGAGDGCAGGAAHGVQFAHFLQEIAPAHLSGRRDHHNYRRIHMLIVKQSVLTDF